MKHAPRPAAVLLALALACFGLTACSDSDDCDASSAPATTVQVEPAGFDAKPRPQKAGISKPRPNSGPKTKPRKPATGHGSGTTVHIDTDDCEDNDS